MVQAKNSTSIQRYYELDNMNVLLKETKILLRPTVLFATLNELCGKDL